MVSDPSNSSPTKQLPRSVFLLLGITFCVLSIWTWQKWDHVWIERSEGFFPLEWQEADLELLAWKYPIYRSNDTYQWVHIADALSEGNSIPLRHRFDEGTSEGRPNRWHSGLAHVLHRSGQLTAWAMDWPTQRGIHHCAHWLGSLIQIIALLAGTYFFSRFFGRWPALLFAGLYYFNAAISWDFAFSRLDHEALFQFFFLLHLCGIIGITADRIGTQRKLCAVLAGLSAGACWWISSTMMVALSAFLTIGLILRSFSLRHAETEVRTDLQKNLLIWGSTSALSILFFCLIEGRVVSGASIASLHPLFILVQLGSIGIAIAPLKSDRTQKTLIAIVSLTLGLCPLAWLAAFKESAHPWLDPMMRRLHDHIVEFQSPFANGLWSNMETIQASTIALLALIVLLCWRSSKSFIWIGILPGLITLSCLQTRWLGLLACTATCAVCCSLNNKDQILRYIGVSLIAIMSAIWANKWIQIEEKPGPYFVTDLMLQVGARDINLNLQRLANGKPIAVAMPYGFAATSALFKEIRPIGTFYWENHEGIRKTADFFAGLESQIDADFIVVQSGLQGAPFAKLSNWVAKGNDEPENIDKSPVWKFSASPTPPGDLVEFPFMGTFAASKLNFRIFLIEP